MSEVARFPEPEHAASGDGRVYEPEPLEGETNPHVLVLGGEVFTCGSNIPVGLLIRYADSGLLQMHHVLERVVPKDEHDRMWDAFMELSDEQAVEAVGNLVATYSERPTEPPPRSSPGQTTTGPR